MSGGAEALGILGCNLGVRALGGCGSSVARRSLYNLIDFGVDFVEGDWLGEGKCFVYFFVYFFDKGLHWLFDLSKEAVDIFLDRFE